MNIVIGAIAPLLPRGALSTMNEKDAKAALSAIGITPNAGLIRNWLRANTHEEQNEPLTVVGGFHAGERSTEIHQQSGSGKSRLEPVLRETGTWKRQPTPRKHGRPRIVASWFEKVAATMADGTSLKAALVMNGLKLSKSEVRACYRNKTLKAMYQEARRRYLAEHYGRKPTLRSLMGKYV
jgi:hypothetical protein